MPESVAQHSDIKIKPRSHAAIQTPNDLTQSKEVPRMPGWREVVDRAQSFSGPLANLKRDFYLMNNEQAFQQAIESEDEFAAAVSTLCYIGEPEFSVNETNINKTMVLKKFKADFVKKNLDLIRERLANESPQKHLDNVEIDSVIAGLGIFLKPEYSLLSDSMVQFFIDNFQRGSKLWKMEDFFSYIFENGNSDQRQWAYKEILNQLGDQEITLGKRARILSYSSEGLVSLDPQDPVRQDLEDLFSKELGKYGLESEDVLDVWIESDERGREADILRSNLSTIYTIEALRPGISKVLWTEYGIYDFGRYPIDLLIWQYDNRNNPNVPYGVLVYPQADHNGAFYQDKPIFNKLHFQLQGLGYGLRIYEVGTGTEVIRALNSADKKYGSKNKISFIIIGGHGSRESITLGDEKKGVLNLSELLGKSAHGLGKRFSELKSLFIDSPNVVLVSCSTGVKVGFAHELSLLGAKVIGPEDITSLEGIEVRDQNGRLEFDVRYNEAKRGLYHRGVKIE